MIWLKKIIAILAVSFIASSANLKADILDEIPADIRDYVLVLKFSETYALPNTVNFSVGEVVPIPTDCS